MGAATGVDILDRHKALFAPGNCARSENTFSDGEGAFIVNKSGPVRAIRSYVGANSGPLTQREHFFYERRQDIRTSLRVHAIPGIMDFFDYSPAATGMTYYDDLNTSGVTVDGNPDSVALGAIQWEMVSGAQGSLLMTSLLSTNIAGLTYTSYYLDDSTPDVTQCTGDAFAYGSSGVRVNQTIACTDPALDCTNYLHGTRIMYYEAPGLTVAGAQALSDQANTPLTYTSRLWRSDIDGDGIPDSVDNCPSVFNPGQENTDAAIDNGPGISGDDKTIPNAVADNVGDACQTDPDIDHDGLPNSEDMNPLGATGICARFAGADDGHPNPAGGDVTNDDDHDGNPAPPMGTDTADNGPSWDTDNDGVLDGVECALGHNPRDAGDRPSEAECGGAGDTDGDGLLDAWETCKWGTNPNIVDSDGDTLGDCTEAVDTNGNGIILGDFSADALNSARATLLPAGVGPGRFGKTMDFDLNGNGIVAGDFGVDTLETDRFTLGILPCQ
jgi:hypothetical protein